MNSTIKGTVAVITRASSGLVAFAVSQPDAIDVNGVLFRPTTQEMWWR